MRHPTAVAITVALFVLSTLTACEGASHSTKALAEVDSAGGKGIRGAAVGERLLFGLTELKAYGDETVHFRRAKLLDVPLGLVVDGIWALRVSEAGDRVGALRGRDVDPYREHFHRITDVVLDPRCLPEPKCLDSDGRQTTQDWYLAAEVHIDRAGRFATKGHEITYHVGGEEVTQSFTNWVIIVESA